jgi:hypothetical protein
MLSKLGDLQTSRLSAVFERADTDAVPHPPLIAGSLRIQRPWPAYGVANTLSDEQTHHLVDGGPAVEFGSTANAVSRRPYPPFWHRAHPTAWVARSWCPAWSGAPFRRRALRRSG